MHIILLSTHKRGEQPIQNIVVALKIHSGDDVRVHDAHTLRFTVSFGLKVSEGVPAKTRLKNLPRSRIQKYVFGNLSVAARIGEVKFSILRQPIGIPYAYVSSERAENRPAGDGLFRTEYPAVSPSGDFRTCDFSNRPIPRAGLETKFGFKARRKQAGANVCRKLFREIRIEM